MSRRALLRYLPLLLLALAWELGARTGLVSTLALPPLSTVVAAWIELFKDGELLANGAASLWRAGAGLFLAVLVGAALGIFMAWWRPVNVLLSPLVEMFYPMPKSALIPVTVLWLGGVEIFTRNALAPHQFILFVTALVSTTSPIRSLSEVNANIQGKQSQ